MLALLVDGENLSSRHAEQVLAAVPDDCAVRRVYGDVARLNGWLAVPMLTPVHVPPGRNASDIAIAVDAIGLVSGRSPSSLAIATSDGGLGLVVVRLRELGHRVTVISEAKAPPALRGAANHFVELPSTREAVPAPAEAVKARLPVAEPRLGITPRAIEDFLGHLVARSGEEGLPLVKINPEVYRALGARISALPERTWRTWIAARPHLFALDPRGPDARVRLTGTS